MNLTALRTEFLARGEDFLDSAGTTRQDYFLNTAYHRICESYDWPWLFADATGTAPLTITDLRTVHSVVDTTNNNKLVRLDRRQLQDLDPALTSTGAPTYYYRDNETDIKVWPVSSVTLAVRYLKVPPSLALTTDTPLVPARWHNLIVDGAMVEAFKDSEDYNELNSLEAVFQQRLSQMKSTYIDESGPGYIDPVNNGWFTSF